MTILIIMNANMIVFPHKGGLSNVDGNNAWVGGDN